MERRQVLTGAGILAGITALGGFAQSSPATAQPAPATRNGCGGTIARFAASGHDVVLLYLNDGAWAEIAYYCAPRNSVCQENS